MRRLIVATDLSERGRQALDRSLLLASGGRVELLLVHVVPQGAGEERLRAARRSLETLAGAVLAPRGVTLRPLVLTGPVPETLAGTARAEEAELIVLGPHGRRRLADLVMGATADHLLRLRSAPVLVASRPASGPYRRVLAAIDLSASSREAVLCARRLGLLEGAELLLLHARGPLGEAELLAAGVPEAIVRSAVEEGREELRDFAAGLRLDHDRLRQEAVVGAPADAIRDHAAAFDADLVVVGTHGRGGLERAVLGSVAEQVLRGLDRDVLAVPPMPGAA
jgi:universal stress protein E